MAKIKVLRDPEVVRALFLVFRQLPSCGALIDWRAETEEAGSCVSCKITPIITTPSSWLNCLTSPTPHIMLCIRVSANEFDGHKHAVHNKVPFYIKTSSWKLPPDLIPKFNSAFYSYQNIFFSVNQVKCSHMLSEFIKESRVSKQREIGRSGEKIILWLV